MSGTLLELTSEGVELYEALRAAGDDLDPETKEEAERILSEIQFDLDQKLDTYAYVRNEIVARIAGIEELVTKYQKLLKTEKNALEGLDHRLLTAALMMGKREIKTSKFRLTVRTNPPSATITDPQAAVDAGFGEIVQDLKVDKRKLIAAWKSDPSTVAPFAEISQRERIVLS